MSSVCSLVPAHADERSPDDWPIYGCLVTDRRWSLLQEMEPALLEAFSELGVIRIEYVAAFPDLDGAWVWLGTATDAERDAFGDNLPHALAGVRQIAERCGFPPDQVNGLTVQSAETVARDYEGSWFSALR